MRIDLCSQSFQFKFLKRDLILINFFDQPVDLIHHMMEAPYQLTHLVLWIAVNRNLSASLVDLFHISGKQFNISGKQFGKSHPQNNNDHNAEADQRDFTDQKFGDRALNHCRRLIKIISPSRFVAAGADISIFLPEPVQHFFGTFLRGNIAGSQIFPVVNHIFLLIYHYAAGISLNNIGKRPENFFIIKSNAKNCVTFFFVINLTHSCNLPIVTVYDPLRHHTSVQFAAPPFPVHLIQRNQRIFMAYRNALCKKLYSKNGIVIGFRHSKKWIYYLCILFISGIPVHILILDHFQNLRRISEII